MDLLAIMGDFNIAPKAEDVTNPEAMLNKVSFHPKEHALLAKLTDLGLSDLFRKFDTRPGQFSWWDFRTWVLNVMKECALTISWEILF